MKRKWIVVGGVAALMVGASAYAVLSRVASEAGSETAAQTVVQMAPSVRVVAAERRELIETLEVNGTVLPREEALVGTDLSGLTVLELRVEEGDRVEKGQVLALLDREPLEIQLAQMEANAAQIDASIAQMKAQWGDMNVGVAQAQDAYDRAAALQQKGVSSQAQLDTARHGLDSANAKLEASEKAMGATQAQLGVVEAQKRDVLNRLAKTEVKAPADGIVLARNATIGGVVSASSGALFRISIGGELELAARVPETALPRLAPGMPARVSMTGLQLLEGRIRLISPQIDAASRLGTIRISLPGDPGVRSGNFARGTIETARRDAIAVPEGAVNWRGGEALLQAVADGVVHTKPVTLGVRAAGWVEVLSGLSEGEEVVSRAGTFVADGDRVTPVREERAVAGAVAR